MSNIRDLVVAELARNPGETRGHVIARVIGRPQSESTVYRVLRDLQGKQTAGFTPGGAGTGGSGPAREDYQPRGLTRRRIEEWLDANPGETPTAGELAEILKLNPSTVGKNMREIIKRRNVRARPKAAAKPKASAQVAALKADVLARGETVAAGEPAANGGVTALLLRLQAGNFADVPLPPNVLIRQPGGPHHRDGIARDADGRIFELREL